VKSAADTTSLSFGVGSRPDNWGKIAILLIIGYLSMTRSFAYLGLPWINLFVGEMTLAAFLFFGPRTKQGAWLRIARHDRRLRRFGWLLLLLLCYGAFEALPGILSGYPAFTAARDTAFNYYPLFLFFGIWVGLRDRDFLRRVARALAWWNGCYGLAYVLFLSHLSWTMPGTSGAPSDVPLFGQPYGSAVAILGLIAFEPALTRIWHLIALNILVMLWVQIRAEWVVFVVGALAFAWCTKRLKPLAIATAAAVILLAVMYVANIDLPSPEGRGGQFSAHDLVARAVAPFDRDLAASLSAKEDVNQFAGTAGWRLVWWISIWGQVHASASSALLGFGYGYPIGDLNPFIEEGYFIQTPHNDFFYALGFSGWIGVMLFGLLQFELLRLLWRSYKITGQPFGLMCWAALLAGSMFEDFFEAPFGAIPFYLLVGIALAPGLLSARVVPAAAAALAIPPRAQLAET
jgi:hypothetical protein